MLVYRENYNKEWYSTHKERRRQINNSTHLHNPIQALLIAVKSRAKKTGIPFDITAEDIAKPTHCPVLGMKLKYPGSGRKEANSASLDRIIPEKGYVRGNVIVVSWRANLLKRDATIQEMKALYEFYKTIITEEIYETDNN